MKRIIILLAIGFFVSGCNTVEGIGKDLKQGGAAIEKAATK